MTISGKRKRTIVVGSCSRVDDDPTAPIQPPAPSSVDCDMRARLEHILKLRETEPEKNLREYIQAAKQEQKEREEACDAYKNRISKLEEELESLRLRLARVAVAGRSASAPEIANVNSVANESGVEVSPGGERKPKSLANEARPNPPDTAERSVRTRDTTSYSPCSPCDQKLFDVMKAFTGITPGVTTKDEDGNECYEFTVSSKVSGRSVKFTVGHAGTGDGDQTTLVYQALNAPEGCIFDDALEFEDFCAPVLHREILAHVFDNTKQALSTVKKRKPAKSEGGERSV